MTLTFIYRKLELNFINKNDYTLTLNNFRTLHSEYIISLANLKVSLEGGAAKANLNTLNIQKALIDIIITEFSPIPKRKKTILLR